MRRKTTDAALACSSTSNSIHQRTKNLNYSYIQQGTGREVSLWRVTRDRLQTSCRAPTQNVCRQPPVIWPRSVFKRWDRAFISYCKQACHMNAKRSSKIFNTLPTSCVQRRVQPLQKWNRSKNARRRVAQNVSGNTLMYRRDIKKDWQTDWLNKWMKERKKRRRETRQRRRELRPRETFGKLQRHVRIGSRRAANKVPKGIAKERMQFWNTVDSENNRLV